MPVEVIPEIVKVVTTMVPAVREVPLVRGLIVPLSRAGDMNETKAVEELQASADKNKKQREKARNKYNKRVIKINDAMKCVEDSLTNGQVILLMGKALMKTITGSQQDFVDLATGRILGCMINKALKQSSARKRVSLKYSKREYHHSH